MDTASWRAAIALVRQERSAWTRVRIADLRRTAEGRWELHWAAVRGQPVPDSTYADQLIRGPHGAWWGRIEVIDTLPNVLIIQGEGERLPVPGEHAWLEPPDFLGALLDWVELHHERLPGALDQAARERFTLDRSTWAPPFAPVPWLRTAQRQALDRSRAPRSLVWGPPGTGKTTTLGAIAAAWIRRGQRVLLVSNNNVAVDGLLLATDDALARAGDRLPAGALLRTRSPVLPGLAERPHLLEWSRVSASWAQARGDADLAARQRLAAGEDPADVRAELDARRAELERHWREAALRLILGARCVACTVAQFFARETLQDAPWDVVVLDEASVTPVAFAMPFLLDAPRLVLGGDFRQLGPVADDSLPPEVKRWMADSPFELLGVPDQVEQPALPPLLSLLDEQSRMAGPVSELVSRAFYGGRLRRIGEEPAPVRVAGWPAGRVVLVHRTATRKNASATLLPELTAGVERLLRAGLSVAVLTPFRAQVHQLHVHLGPLKTLGRLVFGTVHGMQGQEADVAVFDTVNIHGFFLARSEAGPRLINVALSRARSQVLIIADRDKLDRNPWFPKLAEIEHRWAELEPVPPAR